MTIVGIEKVKYTSKKTNREVEGYRFHCTDEDPRVGLCGMSVLSEFVSDEVGRRFLRHFDSDDVSLGSNIRFYYNRFGRVDDISLIE